MIVYDACPVCHSTAIAKVLEAEDHTVSHETFPIWQCAACSLRFTQNVPEQASIGRYYQSDDYISHTNAARGLIGRLYLLARRFTLRKKRKFVERVSGRSKGSVLDVGAGTGAFLHEMKIAGWSVEGVEPDPGAIERALAMHHVHLQPAEELFQLSPAGYDVITLWHVLEHVHQLHAYLSQLKRLCKTDGVILIAVPNYTSFDADHYGSYWAAYDVPRHLYHFSPAAMNTLIGLHGCQVESVFPMWLDSFYVSLLSERYRTGHNGLLRGFLTGLRSNRRAWVHRRRASSLVYVVRPHAAQVPA